MARKTTHKSEKEAKPIVGSDIPMHEGDVAQENFEKLAKKIFAPNLNLKIKTVEEMAKS